MARPLRLHIPGMLYHVISRGDNKRQIFIDDDDYERFLALLTKTTERFDVHCYAYCLLWTHVHLLLQPGEVPLSRMMQQLNSAYCQSFNRRHDRVGHVLQGRYKSPLVDSDVYFLRLLRYIVRNPVAAGYVTDPLFLDLRRVWTALDAADAATARARFATWVSTAVDDDLPQQLFLIGSQAFATQCAPRLRPYRDAEDFIHAERFAARPPIAALLSEADSDSARVRAMHRAFCEHAYTLREIGAYVGRSATTVWRWIQRADREDRDPPLLAGLGTVLDAPDGKIEI